MRRPLLASIALVFGCAHGPAFDPDDAVLIPEGRLTTGSSLDERAAAVELAYRTHHGAVGDTILALQGEPKTGAVDVAAYTPSSKV